MDVLCRTWGRVILCLAGCVGGCAGSPGEVEHALSAPADFMTSRQPLYIVDTTGGVQAYLPDGAYRGRLVEQPDGILVASPDGRVLALGDSEANLSFHFREQGHTVEVRHEALRGRVSHVALSPSNTLAAVTRHPDFSKPQALWQDDDGIYLVDVASGEVEQVIEPGVHLGTRIDHLYWDASGEAIYYSAWSPHEDRPHGWRVRVDLSNFERGEISQQEWERIETAELRKWRAHPVECPGVGVLSGDDTGLHLAVDEGSEPRTLIEVKGRKRGFHDHFDTIPSYHFLPGCDEIVFVHDEKAYGYKISVDRLGVLTDEARETWFFAREAAIQE